MSNRIVRKETDKIIPEIKRMLWKKQGMSSNEILVALTKLGWEYESDTEYRCLLERLAKESDIVHRKYADKYFVVQEVNIIYKTIKPYCKGNCYDCMFLKRFSDVYAFKALDKADDYKEQEHFCVLDPTIKISLGMHNIPNECPFNNGIKMMREEQKNETDKTK